MKAIMAVLIGVMVLLSPAGMGADEPPVEEPVDLSTVHRLALLPVAVKLEPARRPPRANPTILRKESREKPRAEEATDAERLEVAKMAGEVFRQTFADFLRNTGYHLVDLPEVDRRVAAPAPGQELDAVASGRAVGADAVLTLTVTKASNEIGGLYSTTTLSVVMSMVVVSTGQIAWEVEEEETIRSGALPGGSQVVEIVGSFDRSEAAKRRDLRRVAQGLARKLVLTLPDPHRNLDVPVAPPGITTATAVAPKDAEAPLMVQLAGDPAQRASFDLARADGTVVYSDLPMNEKELGATSAYSPHWTGIRWGRRCACACAARRKWPLHPPVGLRRVRAADALLPVSGSQALARPPHPGFRSPSDSKGPKIEFAAGWPPCQPPRAGHSALLRQGRGRPAPAPDALCRPAFQPVPARGQPGGGSHAHAPGQAAHRRLQPGGPRRHRRGAGRRSPHGRRRDQVGSHLHGPAKHHQHGSGRHPLRRSDGRGRRAGRGQEEQIPGLGGHSHRHRGGRHCAHHGHVQTLSVPLGV
ncbi:hypothetical protein HS125_13510 [bacterium]|nr:hypothetical protein [bacterium]